MKGGDTIRIIKAPPRNSFVEFRLSKKEWKEGYTLRAKISMRMFSFLFPGMLKLIITGEEDK